GAQRGSSRHTLRFRLLPEHARDIWPGASTEKPGGGLPVPLPGFTFFAIESAQEAGPVLAGVITAGAGAGRPAPETRRRKPADSGGSSVSRMPSPRRLKASTVTVMASPGKNTSHHDGTRPVIESASILPQVAVGGGTPTPRKPSAASMTIATPRC